MNVKKPSIRVETAERIRLGSVSKIQTEYFSREYAPLLGKLIFGLGMMGILWSCYSMQESTPYIGKDDNRIEKSDVVLAKTSSVSAVEVVHRTQKVPLGTSAAPHLQLAFRLSNGKLLDIDHTAIAYAPFRDNVAILDIERRLVLVSPTGSHRVLARQAAAPPVQGPRGELIYAIKFSSGVEVHILETQGVDRVVAKQLGSVGLLAPQEDGRILFIGTKKSRGVAGLWMIEGRHVRCLTNCDLETGGEDSDRMKALPGLATSIKIEGNYVKFDAYDGSHHNVSLVKGDESESNTSDFVGTDLDSARGVR